MHLYFFYTENCDCDCKLKLISPPLFQPLKKTELKNSKDARKYRALAVKDEDFATFVGEGKGDLSKASRGDIKTKGRAKTAKEAATSNTVAVKRSKGG